MSETIPNALFIWRSGLIINPYFEFRMTQEDVAVHLARKFRFGGATEPPFSVAQHSMLCRDILIYEIVDNSCRNLPPIQQTYTTEEIKRLTFLCLTHDVHETILGDIPSPVVTPDIRQMKQSLDELFYYDFLQIQPITEVEKVLVKAVDRLSLAIEASVLLQNRSEVLSTTSLFGKPVVEHKELLEYWIDEDTNHLLSTDFSNGHTLVARFLNMFQYSLNENKITWPSL